MITFKSKFVTGGGIGIDFKINEWLKEEVEKLRRKNKKIIDINTTLVEMQGWPTALLIIQIGDMEK